MCAASNETVKTLEQVTRYIYQIVFPPLIILGIIGHVLNIILFTRSTFKAVSFCNYCLAASCVAIVEILLGQVFRLLDSGFEVQWSYLWLCRIRLWVLYSSYFSSACLITLAAFDRFASSCRCVKYRQLANINIARRVIPITLIFSGIFYSHILVLFEIDKTKQNDCWGRKHGPYKFVPDIIFIVTEGLIYPLLMGIFSFLTMYNIRHRHCIYEKYVVPRCKGHRIRDFQRVALVQTISTIILTLPFAIQRLYRTITYHLDKDNERVAWEELVVCLARILWLIHDSTTFVLYTWTSVKFRRELREFVHQCLQCGTHRPSPNIAVLKPPAERREQLQQSQTRRVLPTELRCVKLCQQETFE